MSGKYIVVFKKEVSAKARDLHVRRVRGLSGGVTIDEAFRFAIGNFAGYSATFLNNTLAVVRNQPEVAYVEANQVVSIDQVTCSQQTQTPSWGLDRVNEIDIELNGIFNYASTAGSSVTTYIIDTGVYVEHVDFGSRATWGANFANDGQNIDCNGHGTHVAGTVAGTLYGVAKQALIVGVKVLNCGGAGTNAGVIAGVNWVAQEHTTKQDKATANMSLGGGLSTATNQAVAAAVVTGVTFAVAAGNANNNACLYSPASEASAISVGSTDVVAIGDGYIDSRSSFSNYGTCTHVFAPGTLITSAWIGTPDAVRTISGTSMASPHVCGVASLILDANPSFTPQQIKDAIIADSNKDKITMSCTNAVCSASPNRLVYRSCP